MFVLAGICFFLALVSIGVFALYLSRNRYGRAFMAAAAVVLLIMGAVWFAVTAMQSLAENSVAH